MAPLGRDLHILRVKISPAENDQVLDPPGHIELAAMEETEITRAQGGALPGREPGPESCLGLSGAFPVARGDATSR